VSDKPRTGQRIASIDVVRGLVMVLMALDHARIICAPQRFAWIHSLKHVTAPWLATELMPHVCTTAFVFLAGLGAGLSESKLGRPALVRFLAVRGLWLIVLELTIVHLGWHLFDWRPVYALQVIWMLGLSMIVLASAIQLPRLALGALAVGVVAFHGWLPELDGVVGTVLHEVAYLLKDDPLQVAVTYPLLPWPGVMAIGYLVARYWRHERRQLVLLVAGAFLFGAGLVMRIAGVGDPEPWLAPGRGAVIDALSVFALTKHPASPDFVLVTLGMVGIALAAAEKSWGYLSVALAVVGRVPLFFYLIHLPVLQLLSFVGFAWLYPSSEAGWWMRGSRHWPQGYVPDLSTAYLGLFVVLCIVWPMCWWFARVKRQSQRWWLRYL
jgi:uncharacterized membrane protein